MAKLAEQAERFDDMIEYVKEVTFQARSLKMTAIQMKKKETCFQLLIKTKCLPFAQP